MSAYDGEMLTARYAPLTHTQLKNIHYIGKHWTRHFLAYTEWKHSMLLIIYTIVFIKKAYAIYNVYHEMFFERKGSRFKMKNRRFIS